MKLIKYIICVSTLTLSLPCLAQEYSKNILDISTDLGYSNDLSSNKTYRSFSFPENIVVEDRQFARTRNFAISYTRFVTSSVGFGVLIGQTRYGFDYQGRLETLNTPINGFYRVSFLEFGFTILKKIPLNSIANIIIESGFRLHSDESSRSNSITFSDVDSYTFSFFSGLEVLMLSERFFIKPGLQFKIPLRRYNVNNGGNPGFFPYFIGIKIALNYQF